MMAHADTNAAVEVLPQRIVIDATQKWTAHLPLKFGVGVILGGTASGKKRAILQLFEEGIIQVRRMCRALKSANTREINQEKLAVNSPPIFSGNHIVFARALLEDTFQ